jgi:hypothetical protein
MPRRVIFHWQNASHRGFGRTLSSWLFSEAANQAWSIADSILSLQAFLHSSFVRVVLHCERRVGFDVSGLNDSQCCSGPQSVVVHRSVFSNGNGFDNQV